MKKIDRVYVAPEINLDEKTFYSVFFLEKPVFCTSSKPNVVLFDDYYTPQFSYNRKKLYEFISDFNDLVGINFVYAQTGFSQDRNSQLGNLALYCASQQGKFVELERTMTGIYCNNPFGGDETILTDPEIKGCWTLSNHFGKPLNLFEIDVAFSRTSLDKEDFKKCFDNNEQVYSTNTEIVESLGIKRTGLALVDCQELVETINVRDSFCARHPEFEKCSLQKEQN